MTESKPRNLVNAVKRYNKQSKNGVGASVSVRRKEQARRYDSIVQKSYKVRSKLS